MNESNDPTNITMTAETSSHSYGEVVDTLREDIIILSDGGLSHDEIDTDGDVFDYGYLNSLTATIFLTRIKERYGETIEDRELVSVFTSLSAVAQRICGKN